MKRAILLATLLALPSAGRAQTLPPSAVEAPIPDDARTQVLVLGTAHLAGLGDDFEPGLLAGVLDALERFRPNVIAVEALPPEEIARLIARAEADPEGAAAQILAVFAAGAMRYGAVAQRVLGIDHGRALAVADSLLREPGTTDPETRRRLTVYLLAGYDEPSAILQWSYLPDSLRAPGGVVTDTLAAFLERRLRSPNERVSVAAALARRLGLQRLASVDDHVDDEVGVLTGLNDALSAEVTSTKAYRDLMASPYMQELQRQLPDAAAAGDLLPLYRRLNSEEWLRRDVAGQWHVFYRTGLESGLDRARVALWEARNLHIAARIRQAVAFHPGGRALVIIGASHKSFLDRYLDAMLDVRVVHLRDIAPRR